ncbi:MAG TPA: MATE family efflux transporter [Alloprevotella sp.]|nr:MATE family efflux transporter [Alloprevotella sp.]
MKKGKTERLLSLIRKGKPMTLGQQLSLTAYLSVPAIMAQVSSIAMQYIDASMVGSLGANAAASIGLVSTTTWLFGGLCAAAATGFSVQVAHRIGSGDFADAKMVFRQSVTAVLVFSSLLAVIGVSVSGMLPGWLGGDEAIRRDSSLYFLIFSLFQPALQLNFLAGGMLRCSGNMRVPSMLNILMCLLDVVFNFFLIFPSRQVGYLGVEFTVPGVGLGVAGAISGTVLAELITAGAMMWYLCRRSPMLRLSGKRGGFLPRKETLHKAFRISLPMGFEHAAICGAQIMTTIIVAPLGIVAIAANSFAIIAESLCYMPGYGISEAATTLVGQSLGANRIRLLRSFANITVWSGMLIMGFMGALMYVAAPQIIGVMTPVEDIRTLGAEILRIEAFAEPMFAASIVAYGVFVGVGGTFVPSLMNFGSIWGVRLTLAAWFAPTMGLRGVWLAMCVELCFRGTIFLVRLWRGNWIYKLRVKR